MKMTSLRCWSFYLTTFSWFCGKCLPADSRHSNKNKLRPFCSRYLSLIIRTYSYSLCPQQPSRFIFTYRYFDYVLSLINPDFEQYLGQVYLYIFCILLNLRSKTLQRASLLLPIQIYYCRSGGMVNFKLPYTTKEMISISKSPTFRSWVVLFHLHRPMTFFISQLMR